MLSRVVFVGQSDLLLSTLAAHPELDVVRAYFPPSCTQRAKLLTVCLYYSIPFSYAETSEEIEEEFPPAIDLGLCAFFKYLNPTLLKKTRLGFINLHPAPLPEFPGRLPIVDLLLDQQQRAGVSLHWMNEYFDQGDLIDVDTFPIAWDDDLLKIEMKAIQYGVHLLESLLPAILDGYAPRFSQNSPPHRQSIRSRFPFSWTDSPASILNHLKAFAYLGGTPFKVDFNFIDLQKNPSSLLPIDDTQSSLSSHDSSPIFPFTLSVSTVFFDLFPHDKDLPFITGQIIAIVRSAHLDPIHRTHLFPSTLYTSFPDLSFALAVHYQDPITKQIYCMWLGVEPRSFEENKNALLNLETYLQQPQYSKLKVMLCSVSSIRLPLSPLSFKHPLHQHYSLGAD